MTEVVQAMVYDWHQIFKTSFALIVNFLLLKHAQTVTYSNNLSPHHYAGTAGHRTSPNTSTSSPQVNQAPSPQGQTLDLSVNRYDGVVCDKPNRGHLPWPFTIICPRYRAPGRLVFPGGAPNGYSRESTPESGGSHYMDHYRDVNGNNNIIKFSLYLYKYWVRRLNWSSG